MIAGVAVALLGLADPLVSFSMLAYTLENMAAAAVLLASGVVLLLEGSRWSKLGRQRTWLTLFAVAVIAMAAVRMLNAVGVIGNVPHGLFFLGVILLAIAGVLGWRSSANSRNNV